MMKIQRMMKLLIVPAVLLAMTGLAPSLLGQVDGRMLRDKSGSPIEEVFPLRLGTALAVDYGENHQVCKMEIRPARNVSSVIPAALIGELINEIVPLFTRGTPGRQSVACSGINCREMAEYERIIIGRSAGDVTPNPQAETQNPLAVILFKSCQARTDSVITNTVCRSALLGQGGSVQRSCGLPVEEVFKMQPGITLTVIYGSNQQACRMDIRLASNASPVPVSPIEQLVDEIVPPIVRGTLKLQLINCNGACWMTTDYENVHIDQDRGNPISDQGGGIVTPNPEAAHTVLATIQIKSCEVTR